MGELYWDKSMRLLYATDASAYREIPLAVAHPKTEGDLIKLIEFADSHLLGLIPRAAGTSLAGQVVGKGIVVDISKYFTEIIEVNEQEKWVRVQPGVIRDELNQALDKYGLYFGPETSTANRAMIGGMVGNNSCGSNSLIYGSTRDHTLEIKALLSDGSKVHFKEISFDGFVEKCRLPTLEGKLYKQAKEMLGNYAVQQRIIEEFPKSSIRRRNTGYAIDELLKSDPFIAGKGPFNFCKLLCGSEGTLAFITEIKLNVQAKHTLPTALLCVHFESVNDALIANLVALEHRPRSCELMDHYILECTENNIEQTENRFFVQGDPQAILIIEYDGQDMEDIRLKVEQVERDMRSQGLGYHFPLVTGEDKKKVWNLRKAGLGLLSNLPGDEKAVAVIEDTAVDVYDLPLYIAEFNKILERYNLYSVHYAHAATGELHLRPILNLKSQEGKELFRTIAIEIAHLVKKYKGSLSGEHGDGRLRGEFIPLMIGEENYLLLQDIKKMWDPKGIFNPNKIVDTPAMNSSLRYDDYHTSTDVKTVFRYPDQTFMQHIEQCNGSGDCRKTHLAGGTMCPSYMATLNEKDTTRARANILREFMAHSDKKHPFDHPEVKEVLDLCLSCKGCKSECPSSVDMAKLKAEFLQGYYDANGTPLRARMIGHIDQITKMGSYLPWLYNWSVSTKWTSRLIKKVLRFEEKRMLPQIAAQSLYKWSIQRDKPDFRGEEVATVYFFCDEFTNYQDVAIGQKAILLLEALGFEVLLVPHKASGRALISKGLLRQAKKLADQNVKTFRYRITEMTPLIGLEPSAILTFRDEYPDLVSEELAEDAVRLSKHVLTIDEFLAEQMRKGNVKPDSFVDEKLKVILHTHCQQKALRVNKSTEYILSFLDSFELETVPSGCCGMAGSFGYEEEHYQVSMQIGELVLFPAIRKSTEDSIIAANGTSCRHQIHDGTLREVFHPVEILYEALKR